MGWWKKITCIQLSVRRRRGNLPRKMKLFSRQGFQVFRIGGVFCRQGNPHGFHEASLPGLPGIERESRLLGGEGVGLLASPRRWGSAGEIFSRIEEEFPRMVRRGFELNSNHGEKICVNLRNLRIVSLQSGHTQGRAAGHRGALSKPDVASGFNPPPPTVPFLLLARPMPPTPQPCPTSAAIRSLLR
jgi:hypothetical protein